MKYAGHLLLTRKDLAMISVRHSSPTHREPNCGAATPCYSTPNCAWLHMV